MEMSNFQVNIDKESNAYRFTFGGLKSIQYTCEIGKNGVKNITISCPDSERLHAQEVEDEEMDDSESLNTEDTYSEEEEMLSDDSLHDFIESD